MFAYFFLVIASFWILKPLKKGLFVAYYDERSLELLGYSLGVAQAELVCKVGNVGVALLATLSFAALSRRCGRDRLTLIFASFFVLCFASYANALVRPSPALIWSFYLLGDLYGTLMVATFFVFLSDLMTPGMAKRTYGFVGLGGVLGGIFGSVVLRMWIDALSLSHWLWVCCATTAAIAAIARSTAVAEPVRSCSEDADAGSRVRGAAGEPVDAIDARAATETPAGSSLLEGGFMVARSPYLRAIVGIVALYEMVSTIMDFQFTSTLSHYLSGQAEIHKQLATVYTLTNSLSAFVQLFLTGYVLRRYGVAVALSVLCFSTLTGSSAFAAMPVLWVGSLLNTADNAFSYSIHQSAKESLYVATTRDEKYKAKAFIDIFGQRVAKAIAVVVSLGLTIHVTEFSSVRWLSLLSVGLSLALLMLVRYAGRCFDGLAAGRDSVLGARACLGS